MQASITGLCTSYASVISLAVYVPVVARKLSSPESSVIRNATAMVQEEFDRCVTGVHLLHVPVGANVPTDHSTSSSLSYLQTGHSESS